MNYGGVRLATYLRLVEGLKQIGRRDLIELIVKDLVNTQLSADSVSIFKHYKTHVNESRFSWGAMEFKCTNVSLAWFYFIMLGTFVFFKLIFSYSVHASPFHNITGIH